MAVSQCDAEYIVECMRILLQDETIVQRALLAFNSGEISDEAIGVFDRFFCAKRHVNCHHSARRKCHRNKFAGCWKLYAKTRRSMCSASANFNIMNEIFGLPTCYAAKQSL
jgi:hypothetical protein